jgi:hypothetical protein
MIVPVTRFALLAVLMPAVVPAQQAPTVRAGTSVQPDTVTVGDPFVVTVRIAAPPGSRITFPEPPDSGGTVEALDPRQVRTIPDSLAVQQVATWRLAAWDTGDQPVPLGDVEVDVDGVLRRVPLGALAVHVRSVLPADSAQRVPKPARDLFEFGPPWWTWLVAALIAAALLALLWWWWRRRQRREAAPVDPFEEATSAFERVEALGLVSAGERGRHVALMVDVLRGYLAAIIPEALESRTSSELLTALAARATVPTTRLATVLGEADLIKFARRSITADRARALGEEARAIAVVVHDADEAERAAMAAAAADAADAARHPGRAA